jgi:hypothetical protein
MLRKRAQGAEHSGSTAEHPKDKEEQRPDDGGAAAADSAPEGEEEEGMSGPGGILQEGATSNDEHDAGGAGEDRVSQTLSSRPSPRRSSQRSSNKSSSSSTPPSRNATAEGGYGRLNSSLRSVLFHPTGLPLVRFFNDDPALNVYSDDSAQYSIDSGGGCSKFDKVLKDGYADYQNEAIKYLEKKRENPNLPIPKPSEETLTGILHKGISSELPSTLKACHQHRLTYDPDFESKARTDLLIRRHDDGDKRGIALLLEVAWGGADTELWWKKADQNAQYLELFQHPANEDVEAQFSGPLLFAVLTMDKEKAKLDDPSRQSAQLGVFLCAPRKPVQIDTDDTDDAEEPPAGYRAALLWRDTFTTLEDASKGMGKTLRATVALAQMLTDPGRLVFKGFEFLGPNCCRIGDKVRAGPVHRPVLCSASLAQSRSLCWILLTHSHSLPLASFCRLPLP